MSHQREKSKRIAAVLVVVGPFLMTISQIDWRGQGIATIPDAVLTLNLIVGIVLTMIGILVLVSPAYVIPVLITKRPECRSVSRREIEVLHDFSERFFPGTFSLNAAKELYKLNKSTIQVVWRERSTWFGHGYTSNMLGFFTILPINQRGQRLLDDDKFSGEHVRSDYVLREYKGCSAIYVGGIAASRGNRGQVLAYLIFALTDLVKEGYLDIYTRPTTRAGLRLVDRYCFEPVRESGLNHIYKLSRPAHLEDARRPRRVIERYMK